MLRLFLLFLLIGELTVVSTTSAYYISKASKSTEKSKDRKSKTSGDEPKASKSAKKSKDKKSKSNYYYSTKVTSLLSSNGDDPIVDDATTTTTTTTTTSSSLSVSSPAVVVSSFSGRTDDDANVNSKKIMKPWNEKKEKISFVPRKVPTKLTPIVEDVSSVKASSSSPEKSVTDSEIIVPFVEEASITDTENENCDWQCYLHRYQDLQNAYTFAFGADNDNNNDNDNDNNNNNEDDNINININITAIVARHYAEFGKAEGRDCTCAGGTTTTTTTIIDDDKNHDKNNNNGKSPSEGPSLSTTASPSVPPSDGPSTRPTITPSEGPTVSPSKSPSESPTVSPSAEPSIPPTEVPSKQLTKSSSDSPSTQPILSLSGDPTVSLTESPSESPIVSPSMSPSITPTNGTRTQPKKSPSVSPSTQPTISPSKLSIDDEDEDGDVDDGDGDGDDDDEDGDDKFEVRDGVRVRDGVGDDGDDDDEDDNEVESCMDKSDFRFRGNKHMDCDWVAENTDDRCKKIINRSTTVFEKCRMTCGDCEPRITTTTDGPSTQTTTVLDEDSTASTSNSPSESRTALSSVAPSITPTYGPSTQPTIFPSGGPTVPAKTNSPSNPLEIVVSKSVEGPVTFVSGRNDNTNMNSNNKEEEGENEQVENIDIGSLYSNSDDYCSPCGPGQALSSDYDLNKVRVPTKGDFTCKELYQLAKTGSLNPICAILQSAAKVPCGCDAGIKSDDTNSALLFSRVITTPDSGFPRTVIGTNKPQLAHIVRFYQQGNNNIVNNRGRFTNRGDGGVGNDTNESPSKKTGSNNLRRVTL